MSGNFGFIHERIERRVLILFIMRRLPEPVTLDVLVDLTMCDDAISYFDVTECIAKLIETKHLSLDDGKYSITYLGERNGEILEKNLPYPIRKRAEAATAQIRVNYNRNSMIKTNRTANDEGGYRVSMSLSDGLGDLISMDVHAANEDKAMDFEKGFRKDAEKIYHSIIKMLTE